MEYDLWLIFVLLLNLFKLLCLFSLKLKVRVVKLVFGVLLSSSDLNLLSFLFDSLLYDFFINLFLTFIAGH